MLNAFAGAILRGEPLIAGGEEGIHGLTLSNAMHLSSWQEKISSMKYSIMCAWPCETRGMSPLPSFLMARAAI